MDNRQKFQKIKKDIDFLNNHPAINVGAGTFFSSNFIFWVDEFCENQVPKSNREPENIELTFFRNSHEFEKWEKQFSDPKDFDEDYPELDRIHVPYKKVYGKNWKYYDSFYVVEFDIFKYKIENHGVLEKNKLENYNRIEGEWIKARNFEDLIIRCSETVRLCFGDFSFENFLTKEEEENHKKYPPFLFLKYKNEKNYRMVENKKYTKVHDSQLNLRWWNWFKNNTEMYRRKYSKIFEEK